MPKSTQGKKPTPAQMKVLEAMRDGKLLQYHSPLRMNKPRYWTLDSRKIADASPNACRKKDWIEPVTGVGGSPFARWHVLYTLTPLGRSVLSEKD